MLSISMSDPDREGEAISWHLAYLLEGHENEPRLAVPSCRVGDIG